MAQTKVKLISNGVIVQGNLHSSHGITTAHIGEGSNLYYTDARADARIAAASTSDLSEGSNLYYTDARADARITAASTSDLSEGTNLYYTDARADARVALIVDSSPSTLNTLNELAAALGDDPNFATTTANSIGTKLPLAGGTMTGELINTSTAGITANSTSHAYLTVNSSAATTASWVYHKQGGTGRWLAGVEGSETKWQLYSSGTKFSVDTSGNGTFEGEITSGDDINSPTKIVVGESATAEVRLKKTNTGNAKLSFYNNDGSSSTQQAYLSLDATENIVLYGASGVGQYFYAGGVLNETKLGANSTFEGSVQVNGSNVTVLHASDPSVAVSGTDTNYKGIITWRNSGSENVLDFVTRYGGTYYTKNLVLDRGKVGIGTYTPGDLLTLAGSTNNYSTAPVIRFDSTSTQSVNIRNWAVGPADSSYGNFHIFKSAAIGGNPVTGAGATTFTIDYTGNVGIGTISPASKLHVQGGAIGVTTGQKIGWLYNPTAATPDNNMYNYILTANNGGVPASPLEISGSRWTSGNTRGVIFTHQTGGEIMTIMTGGNVGINNTSPAKKLEISSPTSGDGILLTGDGTGGGMATGNYRSIGFSYTDTDTSYGSEIKFEIPDSANHGGQISFWTDEITNPGNSIRAMTISRSQNVGIGTTSPTTKLSVSDGAAMYGNSNYLVQIKRNATNGNDNLSKASILLGNNSNAMQIAYGGTTDRLRFIDGSGTERITMLNGGNVGLNEINPVHKLDVKHGRIALTGLVQVTRNTSNPGYVALSGQLPGYNANTYPTIESSTNDLHFAVGGVYTGYISHNTGFSDISDISLKENIEDIPDALAKVIAMRGRYFTWKNELQNNEKQVGFIAQEVEEQLPEVVTATAGGTKGVSYGKVTALLVNAIKEQQEIIESLKTRIETLENN